MAKTARKAEQRVPRKRVISKAPPPPKPVSNFTIEGSALLLVVLGVFLALALGSEVSQPGRFQEIISGAQPGLSGSRNFMGPVGSAVAHRLLHWLGYCAFVPVFWTFLLAKGISTGSFTKKDGFTPWIITVLSAMVLVISFSILASVAAGYTGGGRIGSELALRLIRYINSAGAVLVAVTSILLSLGLSSGLTIGRVVSRTHSTLGFFGSLATESALLLWQISFGLIYKLLRQTDSEDEQIAPQRIRKTRSERLARELPDPDEYEVLPEIEELELIRHEDTDEELADFAYSENNDEGLEVKIFRRDDLPPPVQKSKAKPVAAKASNSSKFQDTRERAPQEFEIPSPELLVRSEGNHLFTPKDKDLIQNSKRLEQSLQNFRIGGKVVEVQPGPVITLYEFEPAPGVKVQRIISLADDLALALKVASVRVYAPVPGKGTVGIEVPNENREIVRLRDLIETKSFQDPQYQIALALGKDTFGEPYIADLSKMPHLLIAGATGTGKSVCINSLLLSLLYRNTPEDLRLLLIDPKMLELSVYEDIPHLKAPVVTQAKRARGVLWWAVEEMERRYALMKDVGVRNLASYNSLVQSKSGSSATKKKRNKVIELLEKDVVATSSNLPALDREISEESGNPSLNSGQKLESLPRIVIVVDELADLMLSVGREIEELLTRLAQKARAAGIHLILATQRPSVNVITGLIKANFPSRISFKVASRIDARTVLDNSGAEKLLGQGDMLFLSPGAGRPKRLHSPFVSDKEVHDVVEWLRGQGRPNYDSHIEQMIERLEQSEAGGAMGEGTEEEYDPLYDQAVNLVLDKGVASTSMVQRVFRIGYNRAARILETMERDGVVGPADGAKPRQVLVPQRETGFP